MLIISLLSILIFLSCLIILLLIRNAKPNNAKSVVEISTAVLSQLDILLKNEFSRNREETNNFSISQRAEQGSSFDRFTKEINNNAVQSRDEIAQSFKGLSDSMSQRLAESATQQKEQLHLFSNLLNTLTTSNEERLERMSTSVGEKITALQSENNKRLEKIHDTVDEKLHKTLEERLGNSFKMVSENLEKVQKGLGEMQSLATGVGDLKKVLSNVKTKGVLGEYQLANILEQLLTPAQYEKNVKTKKGSDAHVEFAIKLPGREANNKPVWIPLDSKFPTEDYQELLDTYDSADKKAIDKAQKRLNRTIKLFAKDIHTKYIDPPNTTDFAILFLPIEGLYAEVLRDHELFQTIQRDYKIIVAGPTTLSALLSSLQMGFRTLAIEKRSSEVWNVLGAVKTEFYKFGGVLEKTQKKIDEASKTIESATVRTRAIEKKLRTVEELPSNESNNPIDDVFSEKDSPLTLENN